MEPSMFSIHGMSHSWSQIPQSHYPNHLTISQGLLYDPRTQNLTQNEALIPVLNRVQGTQFPSSIIEFDKAPPQGRMITHKQTRVAASKGKKIESGDAKTPKKKKRYRKQNYNKVTSSFRGVTKCKGRFETFVWDKDPKSNGKKGKTVYIGGFKNELEAARAHDLISLKIWGEFAYTNFSVLCYLKEMLEMESMTLRECILAIRRRSKDRITTGLYECNVSSFVGAVVDQMEENSAIGNALLNLDFTTMQPMLQNIGQTSQGTITLENQIKNVGENLLDNQFLSQSFSTMQSMLEKIGQRSQDPITLPHQIENVNDNILSNQFLYNAQYPLSSLAFQNGPSFQNDPSLPLWSFNFGNATVEEHANALGNAQNCESSVSQKGNEYPTGARNDGISSIGSSSIGFYSMESNTLDNALNWESYSIFQKGNTNPAGAGKDGVSSFWPSSSTRFHSVEPNTLGNALNWQSSMFQKGNENPARAGTYSVSSSGSSSSIGFHLMEPNTLGNTLNWESSMFQKGNENPAGAGTDGVSSFGSSSSNGFHSMKPNPLGNALNWESSMFQKGNENPAGIDDVSSFGSSSSIGFHSTEPYPLGNALNWESSMCQKSKENAAGAKTGISSGSSNFTGFHSMEPNTLGNALNWESSMFQKGNENPTGAENDVASSFGVSSSLGFHSMEPNIQQCEAPTLQVEPIQKYEPFRYESAANTHYQCENMVNDWDISQYLNLEGPDMDD